MRIGIDISQVVYEGTGVSRFTKGLIEAILTYDKKNEWVFFYSGFRRKLDEELKKRIQDKGYQIIEWKIPPTLLSFLSNEIHNSYLSSIIYHLSSNLDWFITSDWTEPFLPHIKKAAIVHDLVYLRYPETVDEKIRKAQTKRLQHVKKESKIIFADSISTKKDLVELLGINEDRIIVNYPGVETIKPPKNQIERTLQKYNLKNKQFILSVGKLEPRKNLNRLIKAFNQIDNSTIQLVIVGQQGWNIKDGDTPMNRLIGINTNVLYLGFLADNELYSLYSSCLFFVHPSIWEGFGYPIIEAMKLGSPVTCSNTSSIKEIGGNAALCFDPADVSEITQCINELNRNEKLRKELIKKGFERSKIFSWKNYYDTLLTSL